MSEEGSAGGAHLRSSSLMLMAASAFAGGVQHGIIKLDGVGNATLVVAEPLSVGETVYFQYPDAKQQPVCCKQLVASEFTKDHGSVTSVTNEITGNSPVIYRARIPKLWAEMPFVGAATIGRGLQTTGVKGQLVARTRQGLTSRANTCTSQEGVHLIARMGATETTHLYMGLGYEVEHPNCK